MPLIDIRPLAAVAPHAVESLLDAAFGSDRRSRTAYRLRAGTSAIPRLSFAAFEKGEFAGTLQSWPVQLSADGIQAQQLIMVGPVAVLPEKQKQGVGRALMKKLLETADSAGDDALMLIGDPDYYDKLFGFSAKHTGGWQVPGPVERHRLLARLGSDRLHGLRGMLGPARLDFAALR